MLLTTAIWLIGVRVLIGVIQSPLQQHFATPALAVWLTASLIILVWQVVGGWRACDNYVRAGGGMAGGWMGYGSLLVVLALTLVQVIDGVTGKIEIQPAPPLATVELELLNGNSLLLVDKPLDWRLFTTFKTALEQHKTITTVVLNSTGGRVYTARAMALIIEQYKLNTHVDEICYSACTIVFLAGNLRTAANTAELGFHQYSLQQNYQLEHINISQELSRDRDYFIKRGVSSAFVESLFQANPESLWKPDRKTLTDAGVLSN